MAFIADMVMLMSCYGIVSYVSFYCGIYSGYSSYFVFE
jgi:hypothetical protein